MKAIVQIATLLNALVLLAAVAPAGAVASVNTEPPPVSKATESSPPVLYVPGEPEPIGPRIGTSAATLAAEKQPLTYDGGYVQRHPHVYVIFWGSEWNEKPGTKEKLLNLYQWLSGSSYDHLFTQYFDHTGYISGEMNLAGSFTDTRVPYPTEIGGEAARAEVRYALAQNGWPAGYENQYVIFGAPKRCAEQNVLRVP